MAEGLTFDAMRRQRDQWLGELNRERAALLERLGDIEGMIGDLGGSLNGTAGARGGRGRGGRKPGRPAGTRTATRGRRAWKKAGGGRGRAGRGQWAKVVMQILESAGEPVSPRAVAEQLPRGMRGSKSASVQVAQTLSKMAKAGTIKRVGRGQYTR